MSAKSYKIVELQTENVKRLKAVHIAPDGNIVEITGGNGNGKSSVLDSIFWAFAGKREMQSQPIRNGEAKAKTVIDLGDLLIRRTFNRQEDGTFTTNVIVETKEGARFGKSQDILSSLVGDLAFDPLEFTRKKSVEQFDILKSFVPDFDFSAEAALRKRAFDDRTEINRQIRELKSQVAGISIPEGVPENEIDVSALTDELQDVGVHNADIETRKANRQRLSDEADHLDIEAKRLADRAEDLRRQAAAFDAEAAEKSTVAKGLRDRLAGAGNLPEPKDASSVRAQIDDANRVNALVRQKKHMDTLISKAGSLEAEAMNLTEKIEQSDARKAAAVAAAKMPVEGIGFGDGYVTLNGVPFEQASSAEQLRAAVGLTMAANPRLRVILIRDGSLLGTEAMRILSEMADEHDFQVWLETVESNRPGAIVIEDGMVRASEALEAAE